MAGANLDNAYSRLMSIVCGRFGYCGSLSDDGAPRHVDDYIPASGPVSADQFIDWLILAEGMDPSTWTRGDRRPLREAFITVMGAETVDAGRFKSAPV